jgi:hypothetical protein
MANTRTLAVTLGGAVTVAVAGCGTFAVDGVEFALYVVDPLALQFDPALLAVDLTLLQFDETPHFFKLVADTFLFIHLSSPRTASMRQRADGTATLTKIPKIKY